jgi:hypothetical protein
MFRRVDCGYRGLGTRLRGHLDPDSAGAAVTAAARATRTRFPSCSISISFNPVSSRSWVSSWINSRSMIVFGDFAIVPALNFFV